MIYCTANVDYTMLDAGMFVCRLAGLSARTGWIHTYTHRNWVIAPPAPRLCGLLRLWGHWLTFPRLSISKRTEKQRHSISSFAPLTDLGAIITDVCEGVGMHHGILYWLPCLSLDVH